MSIRLAPSALGVFAISVFAVLSLGRPVVAAPASPQTAQAPVAAAPHTPTAPKSPAASTGYVETNPGVIEDVPATKTITAPGYNSDYVDSIDSDVVDALWHQTDVYWHQGDYPRIIELDKLIAQIDPHFMEPYATGAWLMESMGDNKNAEAFYRLGVANNPNDSYLYYNLAAFYFNTLKDYQSAANVMKVGVTKRGNDVNDWRMYAHALEKSNHIDDAIAAWNVIIKRYPDALAAPHNLDRLLKIKNAPQAAPGAGEISL